MNKIKILYIITKSNFGGAQKNLFELATSLPKEKFEVSVIVGGRGELFDRLQKENIQTYPLEDLKRDVNLGKDINSFIEIFKIIKNLSPDIVHLHSPKAGGLGALASRLLGVKKIIYTVHGGTWNEDRQAYQKIFIKFVSWLTFVLCHKVIVLSKKEFSQVVGWPFIRNKLVVIPIGIKNIDFLSKADARTEIEHLSGTKITPEDFLIGSIGELHKNKGYTYALDCLPSFPVSYKYFIVGSGDEKQSLEKTIRERGLEDKVFLLGNIPEASKLIKAFDVFLISSIKEGLPYVLLEAGLAGTPIITTYVGGIGEVFENDTDGCLINDKNSEDMTSALIKIKNDISSANNRALTFQKKVGETYSLEKMVVHTLEVYS